MVKLLKQLFTQIIDDLDSGNSRISYEDEVKIISFIGDILNKDTRMSKRQACEYLGISRATFDNYVRNGFIPKGFKQDGFKELSWQKSQLDLFISKQQQNK